MIILINNRLKTSKKTEQYLDELQNVLGLSTKAAIARIAIGLSLNSNNNPLDDSRFNGSDQTGFEFQRYTLFGEYESLYKALMTQALGKEITDEEFFPRIVYYSLNINIREIDQSYTHIYLINAKVVING